MLAHLAIGRALIPSLGCRNARKLEDYGAFRGSPFQVFVRTVKNANLSFMPGESGRDVLCVGGQFPLIEGLVTRKNHICAHSDLRSDVKTSRAIVVEFPKTC